MSEPVTVARPYAKALFDYAKHKEALDTWSSLLHALSCVVSDSQASAFIHNPEASTDQIIRLLNDMLAEVPNEASEALTRLITLLVHNKRTECVPAMYQLFEELKAAHEKTLQVTVKSFAPLSAAQQEELAQKLTQRLKRSVSIEVILDPSLLGGAVIMAGDLVIDGSVRGKLYKLGARLAA